MQPVIVTEKNSLNKNKKSWQKRSKVSEIIYKLSARDSFMQSITFSCIVLFTCTTQIFCAASSSDDQLQQEISQTFGAFAAGPQYGWTDDPYIARTVACHIGSDGCGLRAHHTKKFLSKTFLYAKRRGRFDADIFGFAIVDKVEQEPTLMYVHETEFATLTRTARFFEMDSTTVYLRLRELSTLEPMYPRNQVIPKQNRVIPDMFFCRYLFLSKDPEQASAIYDLLQENAQALCTLTAAASFLRSQIPTTTFVLFDFVDYCNTILTPSICDPSAMHKRSKSI